MATTMDSGQFHKPKLNRHCCVPFCNSDGRYNEDQSLHFHHIPKDADLRKQWIQKIRRDEGPMFRISQATVVCSKHFLDDDYSGWSPVRKKLKKGTVPSVFDWTEEKKPRRVLKRKILSPQKQDNTEVVSDVDENNVVPSPPEQCLADEESQPKKMCSDEAELMNLKQKLKQKIEQCDLLESRLKLEKFGINRFSTDPSLVQFYTGFPAYDSFVTFLTVLSQMLKTCAASTIMGVKQSV